MGLSPVMQRTPSHIKRKVEGGGWSLEETAVVGTFFEMSPAEYCDTFLNGLFDENSVGRVVCSVKNPTLLLNPPKKAQKSHRKVKEDEILAKLKAIEERKTEDEL